MARGKFSYEKSIAELEAIIEELDQGEIGIDTLSAKVKKAKELLTKCQEKLRATEEEIDEIMS